MSDALVIEVVRKTVTVDCTIEEAFRVFTVDALSWWPVENHSIHQSVSEIVFEPHVGGEVYEIVGVGRARPLGDGAAVGSAEPARARLEHPALRRRPHRGRGAIRSRCFGNARRARAPRLGAPRRRKVSTSARTTTRAGTSCSAGSGNASRRSRSRGVRPQGPTPCRPSSRERLEPTKPLVPRDGGVRRRGRRKDEERRLAEHPLLEAVLGTLAKRAVVRGLSDERDDLRSEVERDLLEPLGGSREVSRAQIARATRRPASRVRQPDPERRGARIAPADRSRRGVNPAAWRSRQKSLRGLAKCAPAAALARPGLIPQKTTRTPGPRTSGTAESIRRLLARER